MARLRAVTRSTTASPVRTQCGGKALDAGQAIAMLETLGFHVRSTTTVYPDLRPATLVTLRRRTPDGKCEATLFVCADGTCKVTLTCSHFASLKAVWKLLKSR